MQRLICKIFGHKWKKEPCQTPSEEVYKCTRCGKEFSVKELKEHYDKQG